MERHEQKEALVIPLIIRPTLWQGTPFSKLQALPRNGKPVTLWPDKDDAFFNIATDIAKEVEKKLHISVAATLPPYLPPHPPPNRLRREIIIGSLGFLGGLTIGSIAGLKYFQMTLPVHPPVLATPKSNPLHEVTYIYTYHIGGIFALAWPHTGKYIASTGQDRTLPIITLSLLRRVTVLTRTYRYGKPFNYCFYFPSRSGQYPFHSTLLLQHIPERSFKL
ncbi:MAG TPA: WD40 repeat domain-containing protein [Ktedonobacteraceae bacterium]